MKSEEPITIDYEPLIATAYGGVTGAIFGIVAGMVMPPWYRCHFRVLAPLSRDQCARLFAREFSAITASGFGIESMMRGNDDVKPRLLLGSGYGCLYSFLTHGSKVPPAVSLSYAAAFALMTGTIYKMNQIITAGSERSTSGKASDN